MQKKQMEKELDSKTDKKVRSFMFARMTVTFSLHRIFVWDKWKGWKNEQEWPIEGNTMED